VLQPLPLADRWLITRVGWLSIWSRLLRFPFMVVKDALQGMFHYLDTPAIPTSTNGHDYFFSHLKGNLNIHRGSSRVCIEKSVFYNTNILIINKPDFHPAHAYRRKYHCWQVALLRVCFHFISAIVI